MIRPPKRSVTRFFVPLIDVLILLFCIFLLMPFVSTPSTAVPNPDSADPITGDPKSADELRQQIMDLQLKLEQARQEIDGLRTAQNNPANRMSVRVLEIDKDTGKLYYFDPDEPNPRQEVRGKDDADVLVNRQKRLAPGKDVFFLLLYPRVDSGFPTQQQITEYRRWFPVGSLGVDNPWAPVIK